MSSPWVFLVGVVMTVAIAFTTVLYLQGHLHRILVCLCGSDERAQFWTAFSTITLTLVPTIFAMHNGPSTRLARYLAEAALPPPPVVFQLSGQLEQALIGLVLSLVLLAMILSRFILRYEQTAEARRLEAKPSSR